MISISFFKKFEFCPAEVTTISNEKPENHVFSGFSVFWISLKF